MKLGRSILVIAVVFGVSGSSELSAIQAKTGYHRTKTAKIKHKAFYSKSRKGVTYHANGSLTNFRFKKNHALKNFRDATWIATNKTFIKVHGKNRLYYYVHSSKNKAQGWVWSGYLKAGRHNQMEKVQIDKIPQRFTMLKPGNVYQLGDNLSAIHFRDGVALNDKLTYRRTKSGIVYKHGKKSHYYFVISSDNKVKGWVWHGYLKDDQASEKETKPVTSVNNQNQASTGGTIGMATGNSAGPLANSKPSQPVKPHVPTWATDDGKRGRMMINYKYFDAYVKSGNLYSVPVSIRFTSRTGAPDDYQGRYTVTDLISSHVSDPYHIYNQVYGNINGKRVVVDNLTSAIPLNGDVLSYDEDGLVSVERPEPHTKYKVDVAGEYVKWAPTWYQYHVESSDYSVWRYNLQTNQWDEVSTHQIDTIMD
ncbi:hypothetical protein [Lactiplantibacillus daowaiensis]|uniref:D-alanyl-D-alanine carboxypeptidase n=1 Tax=Lactiplantibacillus daowaiensis TaxID=2559918 RepID=A0ABW1S1Q4_9LACO|nr:hypothetical protein [Lactiplantibacillus daowaiensis]